MQLAFGVPSGMFWGFKLDPTNDLHLIRFEDNVGWREGMTFRRTGNVSINGGNKPLRIDAVNAGGFGAEFIDLSPSGVPNGVGLHMTGNSFIVASNVRIGNWGVPVVESNTSTSPLYLNRWTQTDVVVGATHHTNTGVRVESAGSSYFRGSVGIGTAAPSATHRLHVVGNARVDGVLEGTYIKAHFQDLAEWVPSTIDLAPATVVVLDSARANHVLPSSRAYDASVAGVVSAQPGIALGEAGDSKALIATTGRVRVRVDASQQPIAIGDLLVTSGKPGLAMKSIPLDLQGIAIHRPGTIVGKALESLPSGEGEILVLLSLQ